MQSTVDGGGEGAKKHTAAPLDKKRGLVFISIINLPFPLYPVVEPT